MAKQTELTAEVVDNSSAVETTGNDESAKLYVTRSLLIRKDGKVYKTKEDGRECYDYIFSGHLVGRPVHAELVPHKQGRYRDTEVYNMLDIVYSNSDKAELVVIQNKNMDGIIMTSYMLRNPDPEFPGEYLEAPVIPKTPGAKSVIDQVYKRLNYKRQIQD